MSKRTLLLSASFGSLLLLSATTTLNSPFQSLTSNQQASDAEVTDAVYFDLLNAAYAPQSTSESEQVVPPVDVDESTVWLARAIYSETKMPHEQELVAWVIRNRVRTRYRGESTYREVVLDPYQFSAFNPSSSKRSYFMTLGPDTEHPGWQQALWIAHYVRQADPVYRPFSVQTRHFYSEQSMKDRRMPMWADGSRFVSPGWNFVLDKRRFRFYEKIS